MVKTPFSDSRILERDGVLSVRLPASIPEREVSRLGLELVYRWFRSQARYVITERVTLMSEKMGLRFGTIRIKDTVSRWGSCSRRGNLNFNWRLVIAPMHIIDYLVVHELVHLKEMNHSRRFWDMVSLYCPEYKNHVVWLKSCGNKLFAF